MSHSTNTCPGCLTLPTSGYKSKPPNNDGMIHWCHATHKMAEEQEKERYWLIVVTLPIPKPPMIKFVRRSLLPKDLRRRLRAGDGQDYDFHLTFGLPEDKQEAKYNEYQIIIDNATVPSCHVERIMTYYSE